MSTQKGKARVRHRIDETPNQISAIGDELVVLTAERDDPDLGPEPRESGNPVRLEAGAVHQIGAVDGAGFGLDDQPLSTAVDADHPRVGPHLATGVRELAGEGPGHLGKVHDPGLGHPESCHSAGIWLAFSDAVGVETHDTFEPVVAGPSFQLLECRELGLIGGQHQLAAAPVGDLLLFTEPIELFPTFGAQDGL